MNFDRCALSYDAHSQAQRSSAAWCAEWLEPSLAGHRVLELGAGTGQFTQFLSRARPRALTASDLSVEMLRLGRRRVPDATWTQVDAFDPPAHQWERVYSSSLLQWLPSGGEVDILTRWRGLLCPEGGALLSFFIRGSLAELEQRLPGFSAVNWRSREQWLALFRAAGFDVVRADTLTLVHAYPTIRAALRQVHGCGATSPGHLPLGALRRLASGHTKDPFALSWVAMRVELRRAFR